MLMKVASWNHRIAVAALNLIERFDSERAAELEDAVAAMTNVLQSSKLRRNSALPSPSGNSC